MKSMNAPIYTEPTSRQLAILAYIARHTKVQGWPPSIRDIGRAFEISSTNGVNDHLRSLIRRGLLEKAQLLSRALRVTKKGMSILRRDGYMQAGQLGRLRHATSRP